MNLREIDYKTVTPEQIAALVIDTPEDYAFLAKLTIRPDYDNAEHYILGLGTEAGELLDAHKKHRVYGKTLDRVNIKEEIGDVAWYAANLLRITGQPWKAYPVHGEAAKCDFRQSLEILMATGDLTARLLTQEALEVDVFNSLVARDVYRLLGHATQILEIHGFTWEQTWTRNIQKLLTRYGGQFTTKAALDRDAKTERRVLEG